MLSILQNYEDSMNITQSLKYRGVLPDTTLKEPKNCCQLGQKRKLCLCEYSIYKIRPYVM
jgi:hypothetical protein